MHALPLLPYFVVAIVLLLLLPRTRKRRIRRKFAVYSGRRGGIPFYIAALFILLLIAAGYAATVHHVFTTMEKSGQFGDMFGCLNALVSAMAFIGFLCALRLQRKDLSLTRKEMQQTREEAEKQTAQFKRQVELGEKNQLNDIFFRHLDLLQQKWQNVIYVTSPPETPVKTYIQGPEAWLGMRSETRRHIQGAASGATTAARHFITNQKDAYSTLTAWYFTFSAIIYNLNAYEDEAKARAQEAGTPIPQNPAADYMRILMNTLTATEKEFVILYNCIVAGEFESAAIIHRFLIPYMNAYQEKLDRAFSDPELNRPFILLLKPHLRM